MGDINKHLWIPMILAAFIAAIVLLSMPQVARADGPIYVDRDVPGPTHDGLSWATAYTNLQDGLDAAAPGDEVWVAEGVYVPTYQTDAGDGRTATFVLTNTVSLYGGFGGYGISETLRSQRDWEAHVTVLSGDLDGNDVTGPDGVVTDTDNITGTNAYHVVTGSGVTETAVLDGFTVTGGQADGSNPHYYGGGMYNYVSDPTLINVTFSSNHANYGGGMYNDYSDPTLTNVTFSGNRANYDGGGMYNYVSDPTLTNVAFSGNHADYGGGMYNWFTDLILTNVTFSGNQADSGGGMYNWESDSTLTNVTFSGNHAGYGGGIYNDRGNPTLSNCILWGNTAPSAPQICNGYGSTSTVNYSLMEGGYSGTSNLDVDPLFVDFDGTDNVTGTLDDNLRLLPGSPAVDAGDNTAVPTDTLDLDGDGITAEPLPFDLDGAPRLADMASRSDTGNGSPPIVDMGAYETVPDLTVTKWASRDLVQAGAQLTYTIRVANTGNGDLHATITDTLPLSVTLGGTLVPPGGTLIPPALVLFQC